MHTYIPAIPRAIPALQIINGENPLLSAAVGADSEASTTAADVLVAVAVAAPVVLLSLSDTGIFFQLVGAAVSSAGGIRRGVGSIK